MMKKRITLKDIARETGVHVSTVSRALDPVERKAITEEVAARVQAAAEKLGYASIIINTESEREREVHLLDMLRDRGVDGIIHAAVLRSDRSIARAATAPF
jgi:LacI family transcriptional regulator